MENTSSYYWCKYVRGNHKQIVRKTFHFEGDIKIETFWFTGDSEGYSAERFYNLYEIVGEVDG